MTKRLVSLDALRGFDMLWIVGGTNVVVALSADPGGPVLHWMAEQSEHAAWHGFTLYDLIFPLFLFLAGVSLPFSLAARRARGASAAAWHRHVAGRALALVVLGCIYNGLLTSGFEDLRVASVLGRIGLAWAGAAWIASATGARGRWLWLAGLLVGYWAALRFVPVPGYGAGDLAPGHTLTDYVDRLLLPGRLHRGVRDPEGLLGTLPAIGTALLGVQAGELLRAKGATAHTSGLLAVAGLVCAGLGLAWSTVFPLNKNLWTSSFVLWCAGLSALLLALFHWAIDVRGMRRTGTALAVIGANSIAVYLTERFVDWRALVGRLLPTDSLHPAVPWVLVLCVQWAVFALLYRRRLFLRV